MPVSKSQIRKATEALKREDEILEVEKKKQDEEFADLLKKIEKINKKKMIDAV